MAAVMTLGAAPPKTQVRSGPTLGRLVAVFAIVLSIFAVSATPVADIVPEPVSGAISAVVPDSVESLFAADQADALGFRTYWSGFELKFTKGEVDYLVNMGMWAAGTALCLWLTSTVVGGVVCSFAWANISYWLWKYGNKMLNDTCLKLGLRWYGSVHSRRYVWC